MYKYRITKVTGEVRTSETYGEKRKAIKALETLLEWAAGERFIIEKFKVTENE